VQGGEDFYSPQQHDSGLFLILEGRVRVYLTTPAGKEATLDLLGSGTVLWVRRFEALQANAVNVQAVEPSVLAFMGREDLDRFVLKKPEVALRMMDLLAERLGSSNERMAEIAHKEVLSRLASQILRLGEDEGVVDSRGGYKLPAAYSLHPRRAWHHDRGQPGGCDPCLRAAPGRGGRGAEAASDPRKGPRGPATHRRAGALVQRQNPAYSPKCVEEVFSGVRVK
jgi:CRP-like cAMP-binding protein